MAQMKQNTSLVLKQYCQDLILDSQPHICHLVSLLYSYFLGLSMVLNFHDFHGALGLSKTDTTSPYSKHCDWLQMNSIP